MVLSASKEAINLHETVEGATWVNAGTDGIFSDDSHVLFVNLSPTGLREYSFTINPITPGDFDGDTDVDGVDFLNWQRGSSPNPLSPVDLSIWETNFGGTGASLPAATLIPEPPAFLLLTIGLLLATLAARRKGPSTAPARSQQVITHEASSSVQFLFR